MTKINIPLKLLIEMQTELKEKEFKYQEKSNMDNLILLQGLARAQLEFIYERIEKEVENETN